MTKKAPLKIIETKFPAPNKDAVKLVQKVLDGLKTGEYQDIFIVALRPDGGNARAWSSHENLPVFNMLGAVESAKGEFMKHELEGHE